MRGPSSHLPGSSSGHLVTNPSRQPRWPGALLAAHTGLVYLFLYLPIAVLAAFSFNRALQTAAWEGFVAVL